MAEETNGNVTVYLYDDSGSPIGMQYHAATSGEYEWEVYWYEKNLQGDIVAVYSDTGKLLISYKYTAYGMFWMSQSNGGFNTHAANNPFTYRGYYFDSDLNLYYLGTRYYDYNTGRFVNADSMMSGASGSLEGYNLFVYCFNDPINFSDSEGEWPKFKNIVNKIVGVFDAFFKSIETEIGAGIGVGVSASIGVVGIEAMYVEKDAWIGDDGVVTTQHISEFTMGVTVMFVNVGYSVTNSHSFDNPKCTCDPLFENILEKASCPANEENVSGLTVGGSMISMGGYLGGGFQGTIDFNFTEFVERVMNIF